MSDAGNTDGPANESEQGLSPWTTLLLTALLLLTSTVAYGRGRQIPPVAAAPATSVSPSPSGPALVLAPVVEPPSPTPSPSPPSPSPPPAPAGPSPPTVPDDQLAVYDAELPADAIEIAAVGDVNMGGTLGRVIEQRGAAYPWQHVAPLLQRADITFVNFESTASVRGSPAAKQFTFRSDPASLVPMRDAGVDVASVANNHSLDYGPDALLDTVANLRGLGIQPVGAGVNEIEAWRPAVVESGGVRFAFVAATRVLPPGWAATAGGPGVASAYLQETLLGAVAAARATGAVVIVSVHWGIEGATQPAPYQVDLSHRLVDAGASVVLGHHPHVLQPVVRYKDAVIAYSLGNFVFTSPSLEQTSMILRIGWRPGSEPVIVRQPVRIVGGQPRPR